MADVPHILLAHDKPERRKLYAGMLSDLGYPVETADCGESAAEAFEKSDYAVVILDVLMPNTRADAEAGDIDQEGGLYALEHINKSKPYIPVILFSRHEPDQTIRNQFRSNGIFDYLVRDEDNFQFKFQNRVENAIEVCHSRLARMAASPNIVCSSGMMQAVLMKARKIAESDIPVLLLGETGTGKSLLAGEIHNCSVRTGGPYLELNCASMPENLVESQLFGHMKGAFTGAVTDRQGYFLRANSGTLFLDEIGEMTLSTQAKLLDVIENNRFTPVGGESQIEVDVRIICATNRNLEEMINDGTFREDLYYRIRYEKILIPPLRDRTEDIPALVDFFVEEFRKKNKREIEIRDAFYQCLSRYPLNGNVRELKSMVKASLYRMERSEVELTRYHLEPYKVVQTSKSTNFYPSGEAIQAKLEAGSSLDELLEEFKFKIIDQALEQSEGVAEQASKHLGVNPHTLRRHMRNREKEN